jgi:hypothetical protein
VRRELSAAIICDVRMLRGLKKQIRVLLFGAHSQAEPGVPANALEDS